MRELLEYTDTYFFALINEIFVGVGINLGQSEKEAYRMAKNNPKKLQKAGFFKNVFDKFKVVFNYKIPKFRYKKKLYQKNKPMTPEQWDIFSNSIDNYFKKHADKVAEDITIKTHELGKQQHC